MTLTDIFEGYPQLTCDLSQPTKSSTGKSSQKAVAKTGIKMWIQGIKGNISEGILPGIFENAWLDLNEITGLTIRNDDEFSSGTITWRVIGVDLQDNNPDYDPFYKLLLERRQNAN